MKISKAIRKHHSLLSPDPQGGNSYREISSDMDGYKVKDRNLPDKGEMAVKVWVSVKNIAVVIVLVNNMGIHGLGFSLVHVQRGGGRQDGRL